MATNDDDLRHLRRCVELAGAALEAGDEPFGSVLVAADGTVLAEDHNHVASGDRTRHPEFELARWAAANLDPEERAAATVYTSGEHCPMCAAAHGWVGLGRIVYVSSSEQLAAWLAELGVPPPPVRTLPIPEVVPGVPVEGPVPELAEAVHDLQRRFHRGRPPGWRSSASPRTGRRPAMNLAAVKALSLDCYGTLIDWETGIAAVLGPWAREAGLDLDDERLLAAYGDHEAAVERDQPTARYPDVLATAFRRTGASLGVPVDDAWASRLASSVPDWPAFPDSAGALASLATHYRLIVVSNVHRDGFAASNRRLRGRFAAIITAEDVQAYKPADDHFRALFRTLDDLGIDRAELLHVAQSLFHDHVPANRAGLRTVWINRRHDRPGWGATPEPSEAWTYDLEFPSMAAFAAAADAAFADGP